MHNAKRKIHKLYAKYCSIVFFYLLLHCFCRQTAYTQTHTRTRMHEIYYRRRMLCWFLCIRLWRLRGEFMHLHVVRLIMPLTCVVRILLKICLNLAYFNCYKRIFHSLIASASSSSKMCAQCWVSEWRWCWQTLQELLVWQHCETCFDVATSLAA